MLSFTAEGTKPPPKRRIFWKSFKHYLENHIYLTLFTVSCILNCVYNFIICDVFVLNQNVKHLQKAFKRLHVQPECQFLHQHQCTMCTLYSFFFPRPSEVRLILKSPKCCTVQHKFVPARLRGTLIKLDFRESQTLNL